MFGSTTPSVSALEERHDQLAPPIEGPDPKAFPDSQDVDPALQQVGDPDRDRAADQPAATQMIKAQITHLKKR